MLYITMQRGDYFMVGGNVKVVYERNAGQNQVFIGIDAPKDVQIMRNSVFEAEIARRAQEGDPDAERLRKKLLQEHDMNRRKHGTEMSKAARRNQRVLAGEDLPFDAKRTDIDEETWGKSVEAVVGARNGKSQVGNEV